jgi:hypothetical protein
MNEHDKRPPGIANELNFPVNAFFKIGIRKRGAGKPIPRSKDKYESKIAPKGHLPYHFNKHPGKELILMIEMEYMPRHEGKEAVKAIPGKRFGPVHHIEFRDDQDKYRIIFHYKSVPKNSDTDDEELVVDKDPTVIHPDEGP